MMLITTDYLSSSSRFCSLRECHFNLAVNIRPRRVIGGRRRCTATLITNSDSFEVGKLIGSYGFMNVTRFLVGVETGDGNGTFARRFQLIEGSKCWRRKCENQLLCRLYEGRVAQGPLRGTPF
ncbi:hypothetical protein CASFOL_011142 [Castilleja foliolosa]|uniref:Dirigent protein n=1 Tax=Castilleja foliolosa TaxID=1961234 RepID=A0ABD3DWM4_9LAMI